MSRRKNMSLESALDEERREVMALLEGRRIAPAPTSRLRASSPAGVAQSPVRSMLDVGDAPAAPRQGSVNTGRDSARSPNSPPPVTVRSMLDTTTPPPTPSTLQHPRVASISGQPVGGSGQPLEKVYSFDIAQPEVKTPAHGERKKGALASVFGPGPTGTEFQRPRHNSTGAGPGSRRPMSPSSRLGGPGRSMSPAQIRANSNALNFTPDRARLMSDSGKLIDMSSAYRRLSDANLLRSGGNLANLPTRKISDPGKARSFAPDGGMRLEKDYDDGDEPNRDDEVVIDDSDEDDESGRRSRRGRQRRRSKPGPQDRSESPNGEESDGQLSDANSERRGVGQRYRSLLEPVVTVTTPTGEKLSARKAGIHPNTSFEDGVSRPATPFDSDTEADMSDIRRAQRMAINVSPIHSTPESHRCLRQIIRGDYDDLQKEAEAGRRRQRMYLVATDLSDEAAYALEWTIGTVLRDGDTLLAVYAVDEDVGTGGEGMGVGIGEGATMMSDTAKTLQDMTNEQKETQSSNGNALFPTATGLTAATTRLEKQPDWENMDKSERERWHATIEVSDRCVKLLRKTRLQVRVVVEVFHCKSPKHMITEVIDHLEPTLVVLGSRGRSNLKGVLLGSFSNYLVTKSSVPVMVARKRLRKHSKYRRDNLRLSNMLASPRGKLEQAKID